MSNLPPSHVEIDLTEINKLGRRKYFEDRGVYQNPYSPGSPEFNEFERGWMQSLKLNDGGLVKQSHLPIGGEPDVEAQAERYRSLKG